MNKTYIVEIMDGNGDVAVVYDGKWKTQAIAAGQQALANGAIFADLKVYNSGNLERIDPIRHKPL